MGGALVSLAAREGGVLWYRVVVGEAPGILEVGGEVRGFQH